MAPRKSVSICQLPFPWSHRAHFWAWVPFGCQPWIHVPEPVLLLERSIARPLSETSEVTFPWAGRPPSPLARASAASCADFCGVVGNQ